MFYRSEKEVEFIRKQYPVGSRIELEVMGEDPRPIAPGTRGTVRIVDDIGTVHCDFDNGRRLGLVPGEDSFRTLTKAELEAEQAAKAPLSDVIQDASQRRDNGPQNPLAGPSQDSKDR